MNVAALLQDSPSEDHRRRQELRDREKERERERDKLELERERDRAREREREWERMHELARERDRDGDRERERERERERARVSLSHPQPGGPPQPHRSYSPIGSSMHLRPRINSFEAKPRPAHKREYDAYPLPSAQPSSTDSMHARSYSHDSGRPPPRAGPGFPPPTHAHSSTTPLFLTPLTAPREGAEAAAAGSVPGTALNTSTSEYAAEYALGKKTQQHLVQGKTTSLYPHIEREREREREQRAHPTSGSAGIRPRSPAYGDFRDPGQSTPTTRSAARSPVQGAYSVVPPQQPMHKAPVSHVPSGQLSASRRAPPPPPSLPPPPSAAPKYMHDEQAMGALRPSYDDEPPYPARVPPPPPSSSSSSSMISSAVGREREHRTLKEDIEWERERGREREMQQRKASNSRSASTSAHASPPGPLPMSSGSSSSVGGAPGSSWDRDRDRESEYERMRREDMDAIRAAAASRMQGQGQPREVREPPYHYLHHHHHGHPHPPSQPHTPSHSNMPPYQQQYAHPHQHQQQPQALSLSQHAGAPPKTSRSGVLKLAPPGVTVSSNPPQGGSSDGSSAIHSGGFARIETLSLAPPSHSQVHSHQQHSHSHPPTLGPQPIQPLPAHMQPPTSSSPSAMPLRLAPDQQTYNGGPHAHAHAHQQQHQQQSNKHKVYSVVPTGPGVSQPGSGPPASVQASMVAAQQQQQAQQFGAMLGQHPAHQHLHQSHSHSHSLPPLPTSSSNGLQTPVPAHQHHPHSNPYRHMSSSLPPQHQGYPPPAMHLHYNDVLPPPIPMTLQPMPLPANSPRESKPAEAPLHLGTFVFPNMPFPYFFPSRRVHAPGDGQASKKGGWREPDASEQRERATHVTILIPSSHLPTSLPIDGRPRMWGGALMSSHPAMPPSSDPYAASYYNMQRQNMLQASARRVYTDDSDVVLCAFHSGSVSWVGIQRARAAGLDLRVRLALHRDVGRYVGGQNAFADGSVFEAEEEVDVGLKRLLQGVKEIKDVRSSSDNAAWLLLESASWESGHDGSGLEVLGVEWIPRGTSHKLGLHNRSQRLREYAERRRVIMRELPAPGPSFSVLGKRPARRLDLSSTPLALSADERDMSFAKTVMFGRWLDALSVGFKYEPSAVRSALFPQPSASTTSPSFPSTRSRRRKRRKLNDSNTVNGSADAPNESDVDSDCASADGEQDLSIPMSFGDSSNANRSIILENDEERFLLAPNVAHERTEENKENHEEASAVDTRRKSKGRRYDLFALHAPTSASTPRVPVARTATAAASSKSGPHVFGSAKASVGVTAAAQTNGSAHGGENGAHEPASRQNAGEDVKALEGAESTVSKKGVLAVAAMNADSATSPAIVPSSPKIAPAPVIAGAGSKSDAASPNKRELQLLHRDFGEESVQFRAGGLAIAPGAAGIGRVLENGKTGRFMRVQRWRWAGQRDGPVIAAVP